MVYIHRKHKKWCSYFLNELTIHVRSSILVNMNQLRLAQRSAIIRSLLEGNSIRSTVRMTGAAKNTVVKLLCDIGKACSEYQDRSLIGLNSLVVQCDEIWSFVGCKEKHVTAEKKAEGQGDAWTWVAIDADSKLVITWHVGLRSDGDCRDFIDDLASRLNNRVQLSTDGLGHYRNAVKVAFGSNVDYGQIVKVFGSEEEGSHRYSPAVCTSCKTKAVVGDPLESQISTSYIERQNLTMRMGMRRFTRLTNAFSKKIENHEHQIALHFMYVNYCRPHQTLTKEKGTKFTPAMAAGIADHVWSVEEMIESVLSN
jgi:IS1 family transposase